MRLSSPAAIGKTYADLYGLFDEGGAGVRLNGTDACWARFATVEDRGAEAFGGSARHHIAGD
jgi:hypothetical protein